MRICTACPLIIAWSFSSRLLEMLRVNFFFISDTVLSLARFEPWKKKITLTYINTTGKIKILLSVSVSSPPLPLSLNNKWCIESLGTRMKTVWCYHIIKWYQLLLDTSERVAVFVDIFVILFYAKKPRLFMQNKQIEGWDIR